MSSLSTKPNINFKSEAWKYTPKSIFDLEEFKLRDYKASEDSWGLGPSESQFQVMKLEDLTEDKSLTPYKRLELPESSSVRRASLDPTLLNLLKEEKEESFLMSESLNTTAWVNLNMMPPKLSLTLEKGIKESFCLFESEQKEGLLQKVTFHLKEGSELDLGLDLSSDEKTYRQFNFILEEGAKLNFFNLLSGHASYKRLEVRVYLLGQNTKIHLNGLNLTDKESLFDYHSDIIHLNKDQESTQIYKSLNQEKGHSIFCGRVHLTENSSDAQVEQLNNNLLLGKRAKVDTQPELNIYQDDVKASHGATTGSLEEEHFFYFMSRGFKKEEAKKMLLEGYCLEPMNIFSHQGLTDYFKTKITEEI